MTPSSALVVSGGGRFRDPWHPFAETSAAVAAALRARSCAVTTGEDPDADLAALATEPLPSLLVLNIGWYGPQQFDPAATDALVAALHHGLPTMLLHSTLTAFPEWDLWRDIAGGGWTYGTTYHPVYGPGTALALPDHELATGLGELAVVDERYTRMWVDDPASVYLEHEEDGQRHPLAWTRVWGRSPLVANALGHDAASYRAPDRATLLQRELDWLLPQA